MGNSSSKTVSPPDYICEYNVPNCPNHPPPDWESKVYGAPVSSDKFKIGRGGGVFSRREESGYTLLIPQNSIPNDVDVNVDVHYPDSNTPSVPEGNELVSGVYHIDSEEIELKESGSLVLDQCVNIESAEDRDSVTAVVAQRRKGVVSAKDEFQDVDDSDVDVRKGCVWVTLKKLGSLFYAVVCRKERPVAYCGMLYRLKLEASLFSIKFFFMVVKDLNICIKAVKENCAARELEKAYEPVLVTFAPAPDDQEMTLTLDMEKEGIHDNRWHIYSCTWPAEIIERDAYKYHPKNIRIPSIELQADWKDGPEMEGFVEFIDIKGTRRPKSLTILFNIMRPFFQETRGTNEEKIDPTVPQMYELIKCVGRKENHNIPEEIGTKYFCFGALLLNDPTGTSIHNIEWQYRYNSQAINEEILRRWLENGGRKPVQWATLIQVLKDSSRYTLAEDIEYGLMGREIYNF